MTTPYEPVMYLGRDGHAPIAKFLDRLPQSALRTFTAAIGEQLSYLGLDVCKIRGLARPLGNGLYELRIHQVQPPVELRVFFHPFGDKKILILDGYDKGHRGEKRQDRAIERARGFLRDFTERKSEFE
jgi:putative component of toxin-antitoxin plasmid stabilization module